MAGRAVIRAPKTLSGQIAAYVLGGGAVTLLHSVAYWLLAVLARLDPYLANTIAAVIAGMAGYALHSRWTFGHTNNAAGLSAPMRYLVTSLACYLLNQLWVWLFVDRLALSVSWSIVPMVLATPWLGFGLNRYWTFRS